MDSPSASTSSRNMQKPTHSQLKVSTSADARAALFLVECGRMHPVRRRPDDAEKAMISHGQVFIWLDGQKGEAGLERWTDGRSWGPSRCRDDFLIYEEKTGDRKLTKSTYTARRNTHDDRGTLWHLIAYYYADEVHTLIDMYQDPTYSQYSRQMAPAYFVSNRKDKSRKAKEIPSPVPASHLSRYDELVASLAPQQQPQPHQSPLLNPHYSSSNHAPISIPNSSSSSHYYHHGHTHHARALSSAAPHSSSPLLSSSLNDHQLHLRTTTPISPLDNHHSISGSLPLRSVASDRLPSPDAQLAERYGQISLENHSSSPVPSLPILPPSSSSRSQRPHLTLVTSSSPRPRAPFDDFTSSLSEYSRSPVAAGPDSNEGTKISLKRRSGPDPRSYAPALSEDYHHLPPWNGGPTTERSGGRRSSLALEHPLQHQHFGNGTNLANGNNYACSSPGSSCSPGLSPTPTTSSASAPSPIEAMELLPPSLAAGVQSYHNGPAPIRTPGHHERERSREHHHAHRPYPAVSSASSGSTAVGSHSPKPSKRREPHIASESVTLSSPYAPYGSYASMGVGVGMSPYTAEHQEPVAFEKDGKATMVIDGRAGTGSSVASGVPSVSVGLGGMGMGMVGGMGTPSRTMVDEHQLHQLSRGWNDFFLKSN